MEQSFSREFSWPTHFCKPFHAFPVFFHKDGLCWARFKKACERGYRSAIKLAAFCSGRTEAWLEEAYAKWCDKEVCGLFLDEEEMREEELIERLDAENAEDQADDNECHQVLSQLQRDTMFVDPEAPEDTVPEQDAEIAFGKVKDQDVWEGLITDNANQASDDGPVERVSGLPRTLLQAMQEPGCKFNSLFRLAVALRSQKGGVDVKWLKNPQKMRKASQGLNWYQQLGLPGLIYSFQFQSIWAEYECFWSCKPGGREAHFIVKTCSSVVLMSMYQPRLSPTCGFSGTMKCASRRPILNANLANTAPEPQGWPSGVSFTLLLRENWICRQLLLRVSSSSILISIFICFSLSLPGLF